MTTVQARDLYEKIREEHKITDLLVDGRIELTADYLERISNTNLALKDIFHLDIARSAKMPVCTHDGGVRENEHEMKKKYYENVHKPHEIILPKNTRTKL
ncbi:hypothetical protein J4482_04785 [Candidatus Woesearchaeota archaeon]|nr:hypothetical protein [Candidatus Woesearchaeota archaeon]